jgi:hypothetical protein
MSTAMNESQNLISGVRWTARVMSLIIVAIVAFRFVDEEYTIFNLSPHQSFMVIFFFFTLLGLLLSWLWEFIGSIITIVSILLFFLTSILNGGDVISETWVCLLPAALFLFCWSQSRDVKNR